MKKIIALIGIIFLFSLMLVPLVNASYVCPEANIFTPDTGQIIGRVHPSSDSYYSAIGQAFTANSSAYLYNVTFWLSRDGNPTGFYVATLHHIQNGIVGSSAYPSDTVLATSEYLDPAEVAGTYSAWTVNFDGSYEIVNATEYAIVFRAYNATIDPSNRLNVGVNTTSNHDGNMVYYNDDSWRAYDTRDIYFVINGDTEDSGATPTPTAAPDTEDTTIQELTDIILPWLVPLLICLIPALLGYKFVGELGFFIGLNVGCILAYVTLASTAYAFPLWGIILVGVMDVAVVLMRR